MALWRITLYEFLAPCQNSEKTNDIIPWKRPDRLTVVLFLLSSLVTCPSLMSIWSLVLELWQFSFIKDWPEIRKFGNTSVWVLTNIWRLGRVIDTNFSTNVSNRMLLNVATFQGYSFYCFWVIKRKITGGRVKLCPSPPRLGLNVKVLNLSRTN